MPQDDTKPFHVRLRHRGSAARFVSMFMHRRWFPDWFRDVSQDEAPTLALLLISIYQLGGRGRLLSMKEAGVIIGADHLSTARRYAKLAKRLGAITIERSTLDARVYWLVPTDDGITKIEAELDLIVTELQWAHLRLQHNALEANELRPDLRNGIFEGEERSWLYTSARKLAPDNIQRISGERLGRYHKDGATAVAVREFLRVRPNDWFGLVLLSRCEADPREALALIDRAIAAAPEFPRLYEDRARIYAFELGDLPRGLEDVNRALQLNPAEWTALVTRAEIYCVQKKLDLALADYTTIFEDLPPVIYEDRPRNASMYFRRSNVYYVLEDYKNSLADLEEALLLEDKEDERERLRIDVEHVKSLLRKREPTPRKQRRKTPL